MFRRHHCFKILFTWLCMIHENVQKLDCLNKIKNLSIYRHALRFHDKHCSSRTSVQNKTHFAHRQIYTHSACNDARWGKFSSWETSEMLRRKNWLWERKMRNIMNYVDFHNSKLARLCINYLHIFFCVQSNKSLEGAYLYWLPVQELTVKAIANLCHYTILMP
jgi:hypothetical protein